MLSSAFTNLFCIIYSYQMLLFFVTADARLLTIFHEVILEQNVLWQIYGISDFLKSN